MNKATKDRLAEWSDDRLGEGPAGFYVIQSPHLEGLRDQATALIRRQPLPPLIDEVILVQSNGIAQWLRLSLATRDGGCGIAAGLDLLLPARFQWRAYRAVLGNLPEDSPFEKSHLLWRLMRLLPILPEEAVFQPLRRFLAGDGSWQKRYHLATRLAGLYDQYQVYRADWLLLWSVGQDVLTRADQSVVPLPVDQAWQPAVWRLLGEDLPDLQRESSRAHVHQKFLQQFASTTLPTRGATLPPRVLVFGISALPSQTLEVLMALGRLLPVYVFVHSPAPTEDGGEHPLWTAWGRQGREYVQRLRQGCDQATTQWWSLPAVSPTDHPSLLQQLQTELAQPISPSPPAGPRATVDPADRSITFHVAHSPQREVEILHDQLLAAFQEDSQLQPRDVMVMVPDIHTYAPHIQAVFGQVERSDPRYLPFAINDQDRSQTQTIVLALERLLQLDRSRLTVSQVLDWLEVPAFRAAAGLSELDLPVLERWIQESGIRWGLDADHREQHGLPPNTHQNTWEFGLRRMLLGYAAGEGPEWNDIQPYSRVAGLEAAAAGQLYQLWQRLQRLADQLREPAPPAQWQRRLGDLLEDFFLPQSPAEQGQIASLSTALATWGQQTQEAQFESALPIGVVREHWLAALREPHFSQKFLGGSINFATLMPMRAIPFRRLCLLGMNDGDFPRQQPANEFDLISQRGLYRSGDRSRGDDDRYLFLEAILSARQALSISWVGSSIRDNSPRPPSVLVGQLRDYLASRWTMSALAAAPQGSTTLLSQLTTEHPLQPFSRDYFRGDPRLFTFSNRWRDVHQGSAPDPAGPSLESAAWSTIESLHLVDVGRFLRSPVEAFFQRVLQVQFGSMESTEVDREPFAVAGLERWSLTHDALESVAAQLRADPAVHLDSLVQCQMARMRGEGSFPLPPFAQWVQENLAQSLLRQLQTYRDLLTQWRSLEPLPFAMTVSVEQTADTLTVSDTLDWVFQDPAQPNRYAQLILLPNDLRAGQKFNFVQMARLWPYHLALSVLVGEAGQTIIVSTGQPPLALPGLPTAVAEQHWRDLLQFFQLGMQHPLPVACQTAFIAMLDRQVVQPSQSLTAEFYYNGGDHVMGDVIRSPLLARCWPSFAELVTAQSPADFDTCVAGLYQPLFQFLQAHVASLAPEADDE